MKRPQIEGWTSDAEARELVRLAAGKTVLEVGTYKGFGAVLMAQAGATVWAVDWHRGDSGGDPALAGKDTLCAWWTNVRRHQVEDRVVGLVGRSAQVLAALRRASFDLVFIDADHAYESVIADYEAALPLLRPDGAMAFHDYCPEWPSVVRAVDEIRELTQAYDWHRVGSLAILSGGRAHKETSRGS